MAHAVQVASTLPPGQQYVNLPNKLQYGAGATATLSDEDFSKLSPTIFANGTLIDLGEVGVGGTTSGGLGANSLGLAPNVSSVLATGTLTAGIVAYRMPFNGAGYKKFLLNLAGASTTGATITFPVAFTVAPAIIGIGNGVETAITTGWTANTTTLTIPALTTQTGWIIVEGW